MKQSINNWRSQKAIFPKVLILNQILVIAYFHLLYIRQYHLGHYSVIYDKFISICVGLDGGGGGILCLSPQNTRKTPKLFWGYKKSRAVLSVSLSENVKI